MPAGHAAAAVQHAKLTIQVLHVHAMELVIREDAAQVADVEDGLQAGRGEVG
jgi:hypothetical protein